MSFSDASAASPLSCSQRDLVLAQLLAPGAPHLNIGCYWHFAGGVDPERFAVAVRDAASRCDGLRAILTYRGGLVEQYVLAEGQVVVEHVECGTLAGAMQWGTDYLGRPYELFEAALYRFGLAHVPGDHTCLFVGCHHAMGDGWSMQLALQRVCESYNARLSGEVPPDSPQFQEFLVKEERYLRSPAHARDRQFWERHFSPPPPVPLAPRAGADRAPFGLPDTRVSREFDPGVHEWLIAQARAVGATESSALIAALYAFLRRYFGLGELTVCTALLNRPTARENGILGPLSGRAFLRLRGGAGQPFAVLIRQVRDEARQVYRHHRFPLSGLADLLGGPYSKEWPRVASVTLSIIPYLDALLSLGDARAITVVDPIHNGHEPSPIHVSLRRPSGHAAPVLDFTCNPHWLERDRAIELATRFMTFLGNLADSSAATAACVSMLTRQERDRALIEWNRTDVSRSQRLLLHERVALQAASCPEAIALEFEGATLSYGELDRRSNQLAHELRDSGVDVGMLVGVHVDRSFDMIVGLLAIHKAGAAYLPLDPDLPSARLAFLLEDAKVAVVLTHAALAAALPPFSGRVVNLDAEAEGLARKPTQALAPVRGAEQQLAYVIYTSGSTGSPKGVMLQHGGLCNLIEAQVAAFGVAPGDRILQFARLSFDASIWEIGMALRGGATLCLMRSAADLAKVMSQQEISVATLPPSALALLEEVPLPHLRTLILAGEPCSRELVSGWLGRCRVINAYGPTEVTVCASFHPCCANEVPPIGRPLENTRLWVLDEELEPVPVGLPGEIYILGDGLARGYLNRPALTAQRFLACPFLPGRRMYRSGDRARYREDGCVEFLGRTDHQLKIRGHRVEPGEIEAALMAHRSVEQAVVVAAAHDASGQVLLSAYVVARTGSELDLSQLRCYLRDRLPEYMIPSALVPVERMALTANGKIDREALSSTRVPHAASAEFAAPQTPTEQLLAELWRGGLGRG